MLHAPAVKLVIVLICLFYLPNAQAGKQRGTEWEVTSGDTLYQIGRTIYPGNASKQSRLRQDIMILNPEVFRKNITMEAGIILKLPRYVVDPEAVEPVRKQPESAPKIETAKPVSVVSQPTAIDGRQWIVKRGDTLYAISRSIFPGDTGKQKQLRQDIIELNPKIFANGANNLAVGVVLQLPDFGESKAAQPELVETVKQPTPVAVEAGSKPAVEPVAAAKPEPIIKPAAPVTDAKPEPILKSEVPTKTHQTDSSFLASLGLGYGGDKLVSIDDGLDIRGGSGINFRLGYQQLRDDGHGYRVALGYQYHWVEDASIKSPYLQAAYQNRQEPILYGIGVVGHTGAKVDDGDEKTDYDPAIGLLLYVENVGNGILAGWGLSYTALEFDEKDSNDSADASHAEIYYNLYF
jgi:nucleoid-associated protein YgaU